GDPVVEPYPVRGDRDPPYRVVGERRAARPRRVDQPGVEDPARDRVRGPGQWPGHHRAAWRDQPQPADRRVSVDRVRYAEIGEHVEGVRGDAVAARLVTRERRPVD